MMEIPKRFVRQQRVRFVRDVDQQIVDYREQASAGETGVVLEVLPDLLWPVYIVRLDSGELVHALTGANLEAIEDEA